MKYVLQYSHPNDNRIAVSDWLEKITCIEAVDLKDAKSKAYKKLEHLGTWLVLDIYPAK